MLGRLIFLVFVSCLMLVGTAQAQGQRQLRESASAILASPLMQVMAMLEAIRDYGQAHEWAALVIDAEEIIPAGRCNWLHFVWLSHRQD